jgi:hypothetical protein
MNSFMLTIFADPDILPLQKLPFVASYSKDNDPQLEFPLRMAYCDTCHAYRHPGASHCSEYRICVDRLDQHCL